MSCDTHQKEQGFTGRHKITAIYEWKIKGEKETTRQIRTAEQPCSSMGNDEN